MKDSFGIIFFGIVGLGLLYLLTRNKRSSFGVQSDEPISLQLRPTRRYLNKEIWSIKWNEDGLPTSVTIERDATQT